jgi:hypothetical protein
MTMDLTADTGQPEALFCYRHPDRETYVSCGRCERPICTSCAMMGPVGMRCRDCGTPPRNPLTVFTPAEFGAGAAAALGAGTLAGYVGLQVGFLLSLCIGPIIGGLIAEATMRATGYKRGPLMYALVVGGSSAAWSLVACSSTRCSPASTGQVRRRWESTSPARRPAASSTSLPR